MFLASAPPPPFRHHFPFSASLPSPLFLLPPSHPPQVPNSALPPRRSSKSDRSDTVHSVDSRQPPACPLPPSDRGGMAYSSDLASPDSERKRGAIRIEALLGNIFFRWKLIKKTPLTHSGTAVPPGTDSHLLAVPSRGALGPLPLIALNNLAILCIFQRLSPKANVGNA